MRLKLVTLIQCIQQKNTFNDTNYIINTLMLHN